MANGKTSTGRLAVRGVALNWIGRGCCIVIAFLLTPVMLAGLGTETYGVWAIIASLGTYYVLADLGFRAAGVKYISSSLARQDHDDTHDVIQALWKAHSVVSVVIVISSFAVAGVVVLGINTETTSRSVMFCTTLVMALSVAIGVVGQTFEASLVAMKRFDQLNIVAVISHMVEAGLFVVALRKNGGVMALAWIVLGVMIFRQLAIFICAKNSLPFPLRWQWGWSKNTMKKLLTFGLLNVFVGAARRIANYAGAIIVGFIAGPIAAALYAIPQGIAARIEDLGKGVNSVLMPVVSQFEAEKRFKDLISAYACCASSLFALGVTIAVVFYAVGDEFIGLWIGQGYIEDCYPMLCVLSCAMAIRLPSTCMINVLKGMACMKRLSKIAAIEAILTITMAVVLVRQFGTSGMVWTILIAQLISGIGLLPWALSKELKLPIYHFCMAVLVPAIIAITPAIAVGVSVSMFASPENFFELAVWVILVQSVAIIGIYLVCLESRIKMKIHEELRCGIRQLCGMLKLKVR